MFDGVLIIFLIVFISYKWMSYTPLKRIQVALTIYCIYLLLLKGVHLFIVLGLIIAIWNIPKLVIWVYQKHISSIS